MKAMSRMNELHGRNQKLRGSGIVAKCGCRERGASAFFHRRYDMHSARSTCSAPCILTQAAHDMVRPAPREHLRKG